MTPPGSKCYEPAAFTCALLNSLPMGFYAPAQLVRDARDHGVEVRSISVETSGYESTLERREEDGMPALRLGFRLVKSLSEAGAVRVVAARRGAALPERAGRRRSRVLDRSGSRSAGCCGALASLSGNRHLAFWEVAGTERPLPLAPRSSRTCERRRGQAAAHQPYRLADRRGGLQLYRAHVGRPSSAAPARAACTRRSFLRATDLQKTDHGKRVRVAGIVLVRQHPGSANGVTFMTIEDETGSINVIVWQRVASSSGVRYWNRD